MLFNQIEVDESFSTGKDTQSVVVDDERRFLLPDKSEDNGIPMNDSQFIIDKEGNVVERYSPTFKPEDMEDKIKELLSV